MNALTSVPFISINVHKVQLLIKRDNKKYCSCRNYDGVENAYIYIDMPGTTFRANFSISSLQLVCVV